MKVIWHECLCMCLHKAKLGGGGSNGWVTKIQIWQELKHKHCWSPSEMTGRWRPAYNCLKSYRWNGGVISVKACPEVWQKGGWRVMAWTALVPRGWTPISSNTSRLKFSSIISQPRLDRWAQNVSHAFRTLELFLLQCRGWKLWYCMKYFKNALKF